MTSTSRSPERSWEVTVAGSFGAGDEAMGSIPSSGSTAVLGPSKVRGESTDSTWDRGVVEAAAASSVPPCPPS